MYTGAPTIEEGEEDEQFPDVPNDDSGSFNVVMVSSALTTESSLPRNMPGCICSSTRFAVSHLRGRGGLPTGARLFKCDSCRREWSWSCQAT